MKMIVAIIQPEKLANLQLALRYQDVQVMTVSEVFGYGRELGPVQIYRGREIRRAVSKLRVEIAVSDACAQPAVDSILNAGFSNSPTQICDDKLFVMHVSDCYGVEAPSGRRVVVNA